MSKVSISGDQNGTGDFTLKAPNSNTDRTLTIPDSDGEFLVDGGTLYVDSANNRVGIGTSSPNSVLNVAAPANSLPALGAAATHLAVGNKDVDYGTMIGTVGNGDGYIQQQRFDGTSTVYNLLLQPHDGNVGIGTSSPDANLEISAYLNGSGYGLKVDTTTRTGGEGYVWFGDASAPDFFVNTSGNVGIGTSSPSSTLDVSGSLSKNSGSFKIDHPLKPDTHYLVHSFIEGPQADNLYRGKVTLVDGLATVNLDEVGRMTEGTFVALNGNVQCWTTNEDGWAQVRGKVEGNILTIEAQDPACTDEVSWLVIGERHDQHMVETEWTDENGRVITEPIKENDND